MTRRTSLALVLAAAGALLLTPGALAAPADTTLPATTWSLGPATQDGPDGRTSLRLEVDPGAQAQDFVVLRNFGEQETTFDVYPSDGVVTPAGVFDVLPPGTAPTAAGAWVAVGDGAPGAAVQVTVDPASDVVLPVRVEVPAGVTPGDHPVGVVAQPATNEDGAVGLDTRVGTRIHLRVTGDVVPALEVVDVRPAWTPSANPFAPGDLSLEVTLANTGNVRLGASTTASGSATVGPELAVDAVGVREILPGQEATVVLPLGEVWPLLQTSGTVRAMPMTVGDDAELDLTSVTARWSTWLVPWPQLAVLAAVVLAGWWLLRRRRTRRAALQRRIDAAVSEALAQERVGA